MNQHIRKHFIRMGLAALILCLLTTEENMSITTFAIGIIGFVFVIFYGTAYYEEQQRKRMREEERIINQEYQKILDELLRRARSQNYSPPVRRSSSTSLEDSFRFLELSSTASEADIKKKFKLLAHKYHPDKGGDKEKFTKLTEAKENCLAYVTRSKV